MSLTGNAQTTGKVTAATRRRRAPRPPRGEHQSALLTARMSTDERELVKAQAAARGLSVAAYVLTLVENDARSVSLCAHPETASVPGNNSTKAEGPRRLDEVPHAKAGRAVAAAAG